jgi:cyclic pyranopterin phosphate synthase
MKDSFGRTIDYLRVSITDRCNLRCMYCMPLTGVESLPHESILGFEETLRIVRIMAGMGIRTVKVSGGEPLVRRGAVDFIAALKKIPGIEKVTLTTNGILLDQYLDALLAAGIDGINLSLDALNSETFRRITRSADCSASAGGDSLAAILAFLDKAGKLPFPVKINCVLIKGLNEGESAALAYLAKEQVSAVRFIELMPLGNAAAFAPVPEKEVIALLEKEYGELMPFQGSIGRGPAVYYTVKGFAGKIGFISAMSRGFCETCNRMRLGASGLLRPCLSSDTGTELRSLVRSGIPDRELERVILETLAKKPRAHSFSALYGMEQAEQPCGMYKIGG